MTKYSERDLEGFPGYREDYQQPAKERRPKYQLGQRVRYTAYMWRQKGRRDGAVWVRFPTHQPQDKGAGIIVGKRSVSDGYTENWGEGNIYTPTKYKSFWLVAHDLRGYRYVAEEDLEASE